MSKNEKVGYYYNLILNEINRQNAKDDKNIKYIKDVYSVVRILELVIDDNNDYLLTPSFIRYIVYYGFLLNALELDEALCHQLLLLSNSYDRFKLISDYIDFTYNDEDYVDVANDYENELFNTYAASLLNLNYDNFNRLNLKDYFFQKEIFSIIATYVLINKKEVSEYSKFIEQYQSDWNKAFDEIRVQIKVEPSSIHNSYDYNRDNLKNYILEQINNTKREIR